MSIIAPTIDEFDEPTVMLIIRNLVKWIQTDLVPQINDNDIVSATQTSDGLSFEINLIKGDGSKIPVGKITLEEEDNIASGSFHFDDETRMLSGTLLKEDGTPINISAVEIPGGSGTQIDYGIQTIQFTYQGNNLNCVITQNDGTQVTSNTVVIAGGGGTGGNPYPTAISGTVTGTNLNFTMTMSEGSPVTATIDLSIFATVAMLSDYATKTELENVESEIQNIETEIQNSKAISKYLLDSKFAVSEGTLIGEVITLSQNEGVASTSSRSNYITCYNTILYNYTFPVVKNNLTTRTISYKYSKNTYYTGIKGSVSSPIGILDISNGSMEEAEDGYYLIHNITFELPSTNTTSGIKISDSDKLICDIIINKTGDSYTVKFSEDIYYGGLVLSIRPYINSYVEKLNSDMNFE